MLLKISSILLSAPGDRLKVLDIKANYSRGLSIDIIGLGSDFNDMQNEVVVKDETRILARKDFYPCGSVYLDFTGEDFPVIDKLAVFDSNQSTELLYYKLKVNDKKKLVKNYQHIHISRGDMLVIEDIVTGGADPSLYIVNFKGFIGNADKNDGEDRGYVIDTGENVLLKRYSLDKKGRSYHVLATLNEKEVGRFYIDF